MYDLWEISRWQTCAVDLPSLSANFPTFIYDPSLHWWRKEWAVHQGSRSSERICPERVQLIAAVRNAIRWWRGCARSASTSATRSPCFLLPYASSEVYSAGQRVTSLQRMCLCLEWGSWESRQQAAGPSSCCRCEGYLPGAYEGPRLPAVADPARSRRC